MKSDQRLFNFLLRNKSHIIDSWYTIIDFQDWMSIELDRKYRNFPSFKRSLTMKWTKYKEQLKQRFFVPLLSKSHVFGSIMDIIYREMGAAKKRGKQTYLRRIYSYFAPYFFWRHFEEIFLGFLEKIFPFKKSQLKLLNKTNSFEILSDNKLKQVFIEYYLNKIRMELGLGDKFPSTFDTSIWDEYLKEYGEFHSILSHDYFMEEILFEYEYTLSDAEMYAFKKSNLATEVNEAQENVILYIFNILILSLERVIRDVMKIDIFIKIIASKVRDFFSEDLTDEPPRKTIHFLVSIKPIDITFFKIYLDSEIYNLLEKIPQISKKLLAHFKNKGDLLYKYALEEYKYGKIKLKSVLYTLSYKCIILRSLTPLLDFFNFVCSRVEDSTFDTISLFQDSVDYYYRKIKSYPISKSYVVDILSFINNSAALFSTFQANNHASISEQYLLFFFYLQFFYNKIHFNQPAGNNIEEGPFSIKYFNSYIKKIPKFNEYEKTYGKLLQTFVYNSMMYIERPEFEILLKTIFNKSIFSLNEEFFDAFLMTFNRELRSFLKRINKEALKYSGGKEGNYFTTHSVYTAAAVDFDIYEKFSDPSSNILDFNGLIDIIRVLLEKLFEKIFISDSPWECMDYFRDYLTRYTAENIALRVKELDIFREIPLSDNNWQDYFLSRNKHYVKKILSKYFEISDKHFFSDERLLKINMIYDRGASSRSKYLEEWLVDSIFIPFYEFQHSIFSAMGGRLSKNGYLDLLFRAVRSKVIDDASVGLLEDLIEEIGTQWFEAYNFFIDL